MTHRLCYVDEENMIAYFTSLPLEEQWGDDWNDSFYISNAGLPYGEYPEIQEVRFIGTYYYPPVEYSVEQINKGLAAWLSSSNSPNWFLAKVYAGTSIDVFVEFIHETGGRVFLEHRNE